MSCHAMHQNSMMRLQSNRMISNYHLGASSQNLNSLPMHHQTLLIPLANKAAMAVKEPHLRLLMI
eukprot:9347556-Karenia_brevis.AAC.1